MNKRNINNLKLVFSFLTRFPVKEVDMKNTDWPSSMGFAPICGYCIALPVIIPALILNIFSISISPFLLAGWSIFCLVILTGAMHLDGLADICDGFGCHADKEKRIKIMHDPNVGSFGVTGIVVLLILKFSSFIVIYQQNLIFEAAAVIVLSRTLLTIIAYISFPAEEKGLGSLVLGKITNKTVLFAIIITLPCFYLFSTWVACIIMLAAVLLFKKKSNKLIGGITGDGIGALCEITETLGLFAIAIVSSLT